MARENGVAQSEQERQEWSDKVQAGKNKAESKDNTEIDLNAIRTKEEEKNIDKHLIS